MVVRTLAPDSEAAHGMLPYDNDLASWLLIVVWPYAAAALSVAALAGERRARTNPRGSAV